MSLHYWRSIAFALSVLALSARADEVASKNLDDASHEALLKTQEMLRDQKARKVTVKKAPSAARADDDAHTVAGSEENTDELYDLSADIFETITKQAGGDPNKMQEILVNALKNPAAFAAKFTPAQKRKLKEIVAKAPASQPAQTDKPAKAP